MSMYGDIVWVSGSPYLRCLHIPLLKKLFRNTNVSVWEYIQSLDESACMDTAIELLHSYLKTKESPVNLIGHSIGGTIALVFARKYPQLVKSLSLLAVAAQPARTWHVNYYQQRQIYTLNQGEALSNTLHHIFRDKFPCNQSKLMDKFYQDLENLPLMHSLFQIEQLPTGGVSMPLMICSGQIDMILGYPELHEWEKYLKPEDIVWKCPQGGHFFHYFYPEIVSKQISNFLQYSQGEMSKSPCHQVSTVSDRNT
ncbi:MAG: alpha/beta hydrolase [Calothrix sp. MO_192.B10]|nr:alpha/beta hydrolase [Calothrix sp. MO_192.B10]